MQGMSRNQGNSIGRGARGDSVITVSDIFNQLDKAPITFNNEIAQYVRNRLTEQSDVTNDGSFDVLMRYSRIALNADRLCKFDLVGSVEIIGQGQDYDVLFCSSSADARLKIEAAMMENGFIEEGGDYPPDKFTSLRFNRVNVIVTDSFDFFCKWKQAVAVCKLVRAEFGLCDRPLRVAIHQAIMDEVVA